MKILSTKFLKILIVLLIFGACSNNKKDTKENNISTRRIDTIKYAYNGFNNGAELNLLSNGTFINKNFVFGCIGGGYRKIVYGTYHIDSTHLKLIPKKIKHTEFYHRFPSKGKTVNIDYGVDSLKIKTEYQMITWGKRKYLLSDFFELGWNLEEENDYIRFANYFNDGSEPYSGGRYLVVETKDSIKTPFNLDQIPKKWQSHFLKTPISSKITKVKKISNPHNNESVDYWLIEFNKGAKDGINKRLTLTTKDDELFFEIDSVLENKSFGSIPAIYDFATNRIPIGIEVRTKWE